MPKSATTSMPQGVVEIDFPIPPSVNEPRWLRGKRKGQFYLNPKYKAWQAEFYHYWHLVRPRHWRTLDGKFDAEILVASKRRDADNSSKFLLDSCQQLGIISNDGNARKVTQELVEKERAPLGCRLRIIPLA